MLRAVAGSTGGGGGGTPGGSDTQLQYNNAGSFGGITGATTNGTFVTFTTPVLGVAAATSINKLAITAPATGSTLTITDGKTATFSNTLTLAGTDGSTLNVGTGGTLGTAAFQNTGTSGANVPFLNGTNTWAGLNTYSAGISIASGQTLDWNSDLIFARDAANVSAQRNSTNAQSHRLYNTFTDASNNEYGELAWATNVWTLRTVANGTGVSRPITIAVGSVASGTGPALTLQAGDSSANGGALTVKSGVGGGTGGGGTLLLTSGTNNSPSSTGTAGDITIQIGSAAATATTNAAPQVDGAFTVNGRQAKTTSSTTGTGAGGGLFSITGAQGGNATANSGTPTGGAGSTITITSGAGGSATGSGGTRTGGAAGTLTIATGAVGTGASANGAVGAIIFQQNAAEVARFNAAGTLVHAAGTTARAQENYASSTAPTSPNDGDFWFDGTNFKARVAGATKTFTLV